MERKVIAGTILLLIFEICALFAGLDELPPWLTGARVSPSDGRLLGHMERTESNVRRRPRSSLIWEESQVDDELYEHDSILTLSGSAAVIRFQSDTSLRIDENTLIVLEQNPDIANGSLRIRFSRGNIRSDNPGQAVEIDNGTFTITAEKGSSLSLVSLKDGRFDLEMKEGSAKLASASGAQNVAKGEKLLIRDTKIEERKKLSDDLALDASLPSSVYSRSFPTEIELKWRGQADYVHIVDPEKNRASVPAPFSRIALAEGTHLLTLEGAGRTSQARSIQVRRAPSFRYYSPLPRNRIRAGTETIFSWETSPFAAQYRLEMSPTQDFTSGVKHWLSKTPRLTLKLEAEGAYFWRVVGLDENKARIPEPRIYPIFVAPDPLQSPELHSPEIRAPASPELAPPTPGARLFMRAIFPYAHAQAPMTELEAVFSWSNVTGADHYIIEISKTPGFEEPVVIQKVTEAKFAWRRFEKGTYFWRVAGGRADRLGLFSSLAIAKLQGANTFAGDGVVVVEAAPPPMPTPAPRLALAKKILTKPRALPTLAPLPTPKPTPRPTPTPAPEKEPMIDDPVFKDETPAEFAPVAMTPIPPPSLSREGAPLEWSGRVGWRPMYRMLTAEGAGGIEGSFNGPTFLAFETDLRIQSETRSWSLRATFDDTEWKPKDKRETPFQSSVKEQRWSADLFVGRNGSAWSYSLGAESIALFKRKTSDQGYLQSSILYGPSARHLRKLTDRLALESLFQLRTGEVIGGRARFDLRWTYLKTSRFNYGLTPTVSYSYFTSTDSKVRDLQIAIDLSLEW